MSVIETKSGAISQPASAAPQEGARASPLFEAENISISFGGISFLVPQKPTMEFLYLHLYQSPQALGYAVLARILRAKEFEGGYEIGCAFVEPAMTESILD